MSDPPAAAAPGTALKVLDTVRNQGLLTAAASITRYYLSADTQKGSTDTRLSGSRSVPALEPASESAGKAVTVTIPSTVPLGRGRRAATMPC